MSSGNVGATVPMTRVCSTCGWEKPITEFWLAPKTGRYATPWLRRCKECCRAASRGQWARKRSAYNAQQRGHRAANADQINAVRRARYHAHKDETRERRNAYNREYYRRHREQALDGVHRRRARMTAGATPDRITKTELWSRDGGRCGVCRKPIRLEVTGRWSMSIDHIVPLSQGGRHEWANVQAAHLTCNISRGPGRVAAQMRIAV